jgi:hypothetical protein
LLLLVLASPDGFFHSWGRTSILIDSGQQLTQVLFLVY